MSRPDPLDELALLVRSSHGLVLLETDDEDRAESLILHLADRLGIPHFVWTRSRGLRRDDADGPVYGTQQPGPALAHIEHAAFPAVYHFRGLGDFLQDAAVVDGLAGAARAYEKNDGILVMTGGAGVELPERVRLRAATVRLAPPADEDYQELLGHILRDVRKRQAVEVQIGADELRRLYANLRGLTLLEAEKILTKALVEDGALTAADIQAALEHKRKVVEREGLLEYYP
ncbi:MAG: hypothetical protein KY466_17365, partial [Gemmatimonadetes bacterium]|nr:hypothetical protein [Gemmatimonadota bacterium]